MAVRRQDARVSGAYVTSSTKVSSDTMSDLQTEGNGRNSSGSDTNGGKSGDNAASGLEESMDDINVSLMDMSSSNLGSVAVDVGLTEISASERFGWARYMYLGVLFLVFTSNIFDRYLLAFLYSASTEGLTPEEARHQSIKVDLGITATQYGILTGPAFMITLAISALIAGQISGRVSRKWVIACALIVWSMAIAGLYFAEKFWHVLISRLVLGASEAMCPPLAYSLIATYFDKHHRAAANGFFSSGIYAGYGLSTLSLFAFSAYGWRSSCLYFGAVGIILLFILSILLKEPVDTTIVGPPSIAKLEKKDALLADQDLVDSKETIVVNPDVPPANKTGIMYLFHLLYVVLQPTEMKVMMLAAAFRMVGGVVLGAYLPTYFKKNFPSQRDEFVVINVFVVVFGGTISTVLGGRLTSYWGVASGKKKVAKFANNLASLIGYGGASTNNNSTLNSNPETLGELPVIDDYAPYGLVCALSCLISTPIFAIAFWYNDLYVGMAALFVAYLFSECWYAPIYGILQNVEEIPQYARLMSFALVTTTTSLLAACAPVILGAFDDKYDNPQVELTFGVLLPNFIAGILFLFVSYSQSQRTTARLQKAFLRN